MEDQLVLVNQGIMVEVVEKVEMVEVVDTDKMVVAAVAVAADQAHLVVEVVELEDLGNQLQGTQENLARQVTLDKDMVVAMWQMQEHLLLLP